MYRWELDEPAQPAFDALQPQTQSLLTSFMDAVVVVDPLEYQRHPGEPSNPPALMRTLHFGHHNEGLVTFLITRWTTSYWSSASSGSATEERPLTEL